MLLVAYTIRLRHPTPKLLVDVRFAQQKAGRECARLFTAYLTCAER